MLIPLADEFGRVAQADSLGLTRASLVQWKNIIGAHEYLPEGVVITSRVGSGIGLDVIRIVRGRVERRDVPAAGLPFVWSPALSRDI